MILTAEYAVRLGWRAQVVEALVVSGAGLARYGRSASN